ncbi:putative tetratricopeptide-like helical domain superfamily [Helianthus anomalus]
MPVKDDTFISNSIMRAHLGIHQYEECVGLYRELRGNVGFKPDGYTFMTLGKLCALSLDVWGSQQVHDLVFKEGFEHDLYVSTCLGDMYAKLGKMDCARKLVDEMRERS